MKLGRGNLETDVVTKSESTNTITAPSTIIWKLSRLQIEPKKFFISILLGLAGFAGSFYSLKFNNPPFAITITWSYFLPLLASMAYGSQYGLIAGTLGLGALYPFFLFPTNGWASAVTAALSILWLLWHGYFESIRRKKPAFWNRPMLVYLPFMIIYIITSQILIPIAFSLNPPFWNPQAEIFMAMPILNGIITKGVIMMYIAVIFNVYILKTPFIRKIFDLEIKKESRNNEWIVLASFLGSVLTWYLLIVFNRIFIDQTFPQGLFHFNDPHETIALVIFLSAGFFFGSIVAQYMEHRLRAEDELNESESRFRLLAENSTDMISSHDEKGVYLYASPASRILLGYEPKELIGHSVFEFIHPDDIPSVENSRLNIIDQSIVSTVVFRIRCKNGEYIWFETTSRSILNKETGAVIEIHAASRNVTKRKQSEEELRRSEARLRQAQHLAHLAVWEWEIETDKTIWSDEMFRIYGIKSEEFTGRGQDYLNYTHPDDRLTQQDNIKKDFQRASEQASQTRDSIDESPDPKEFRIVRQDGTVRWVLGDAIEVIDDQGKPLRMHGILWDITERKRSEEVLIESQNRLKIAQSIARLGFIEWNLKTNNIYVSDETYDLWGIKKEREFLTPELMPRLVHSDDREKYHASLDLALQGKANFDLDYRLVRPDGDVLWVHALAYITFDTDKKPHTLLGTIQDITERKHTEEALRESSEKITAIFNALGDGIAVINRKGEILECNEVVAHLHGYSSKEEFLQSNLKALVSTKDLSRMLQDAAKVEQTGKMSMFEYELVRKDGHRFDGEMRLTPLYDPSGRAVMIGITRDITDRKHAEEKIKTALAEKETLLRELYHRTKNNMQVINSLLELQSEYFDDENLKTVFEETRNRIRSMSLVHHKLYQAQDLSQINLKEYVSELSELLMASYKVSANKISLVLDIDEVFVLIDTAIPCGLILNEMISNSLKYAFPEEREGEIKIRLYETASGEIHLRVSDNGIGMPKGFDFRRDGRLGLQIIFLIGENQLRGKVTFATEQGVIYQVQFTDDLYKSRV